MKKNLGLKAYNQNFTTKKINLLSLDNEKHTGVLSHDKNEEELSIYLDKFKKGDKLVDLFRIQSTNLLDLMFSGFYKNGRKSMFMDYFSLNQFQTGILDVPFNGEEINNLEVELAPNSNCYFTIFEKEEVKTKDDLNQFFIEKKYNSICIIAENKSRKVQKINLLDINFNNGFIDDKIEIEIPINETNGCVLKSKLVRAFCKKTEQLIGFININGMKIEQSQFWSANQFQSIGIDMPLELDIKFGNEFEISLLPNTKVMYIFYGE